ncbi:MAG: hypothetical protein HYR60_04440, partial [Acidobacteria bacterium]|nr:hypothetical protein [Acidobacteriota bacterium]
FVADRARGLAQSLLSNPDPASRVAAAYLRVLNRPPAAGEVDAALTYVDRFNKRFSNDAVAWQSLARVLLASNEFFYVD